MSCLFYHVFAIFESDFWYFKLVWFEKTIEHYFWRCRILSLTNIYKNSEISNDATFGNICQVEFVVYRRFRKWRQLSIHSRLLLISMSFDSESLKQFPIANFFQCRIFCSCLSLRRLSFLLKNTAKFLTKKWKEIFFSKFSNFYYFFRFLHLTITLSHYGSLLSKFSFFEIAWFVKTNDMARFRPKSIRMSSPANVYVFNVDFSFAACLVRSVLYLRSREWRRLSIYSRMLLISIRFNSESLNQFPIAKIF